MFAVVSYKGNQYKLIPGQEEKIDLIPAEEQENKQIEFLDVLLISNDKETLVGQPTIAGAKVIAEIVGDFADKKVRVFKFAAKKRYKRTYGHRQHYTTIKVKEINHDKK